MLLSPLSTTESDDLRAAVDDIAAWGDGGGWLHHREATDSGPVLCRTENVVPFHDVVRGALMGGKLLRIASALLGEPAVLYKDKINYKAPGGAGYAAHQDAVAYPFVDQHVSCMVAIDDATPDNGCLEVVSGAHHRLLPVDDRGCIAPATAAELVWQAVPVRTGQTLWFHSRTPHRSGSNRSTRPRRALYPTYNAASQGDLRAAYYERKRLELASRSPGDRVAVSLIGDFEGRPAAPG